MVLSKVMGQHTVLRKVVLTIRVIPLVVRVMTGITNPLRVRPNLLRERIVRLSQFWIRQRRNCSIIC